MIRRLVSLTLCATLLAWPLMAVEEPPANLPAAIQRQVAARETLSAQAEEGKATLRKWYESALDAIRLDAAGKANLDLVLATDAERQRTDRDLTAGENAALPKVVRDVRVRYDQARLQRATQHKTALIVSLREYAATLDTLEKSLTRKLEVDAAVAARKERAAVAEEIAALSKPAAVVAVASPAAQAPPRSPTEPVRATSLSASNAGAAPVLRVASELKALGTIRDPAKDAIAFETPMGFGSSKGGRGVLIKNDSGTGRRGSTWSTEWMGSFATYVYFVHPFHNGHAIVRLGPHGMEPVSASAFQSQPMMSGGSSAIFKPTLAAAEIYPLQANKKYQVVSQFDTKGNYTCTIDGKVVQAGSFSDADQRVYVSTAPLTLPGGFTGEGLPAKWQAGYAALIVAPVRERNVNECVNVTFQSSAPPAEKTAK